MRVLLAPRVLRHAEFDSGIKIASKVCLAFVWYTSSANHAMPDRHVGRRSREQAACGPSPAVVCSIFRRFLRLPSFSPTSVVSSYFRRLLWLPSSTSASVVDSGCARLCRLPQITPIVLSVYFNLGFKDGPFDR